MCIRDSNNTASDNVAVGYQALYDNTSGNYLVAVGYQALENNTTGQYNTAIGWDALKTNTTGGTNTAVGYRAGDDCAGGNNTFLGVHAGDAYTTGNQSTFLGYYAGVGNLGATDSFQLYIARNDAGAGAAATWIRGDSAGACFQGNNSSSWSTTSDRRIKKNIVDSTQGLEIVNKIRVRNFEYRKPEEIDLSEFPLVTADGRNATCLAQSPTGTQIGVIAQEYEEVLPNSVIVDQSKGNKEVDTDSLIWHLVNSVQELSAEVEQLKSQINN